MLRSTDKVTHKPLLLLCLDKYSAVARNSAVSQRTLGLGTMSYKLMRGTKGKFTTAKPFWEKKKQDIFSLLGLVHFWVIVFCFKNVSFPCSFTYLSLLKLNAAFIRIAIAGYQINVTAPSNPRAFVIVINTEWFTSVNSVHLLVSFLWLTLGSEKQSNKHISMHFPGTARLYCD